MSLSGFEVEVGDIIKSINGRKALDLNEFRTIISNILSMKKENAASGLLRSNLLKRFESSIHSFALTLGRLIDSYNFFIEAINHGRVPTREYFQEFNNIDDQEELESILENESVFDDISGYDIDRFKTDLENDLHILSDIKTEIEIDIHSSSKLAELNRLLKKIIRKAENDSIDDEDARQKRKVMVFSYFEETTDWIVDYLKDVLETDPELEVYRGRMGVASGKRKEWEGLSRDGVINGFAPISMEAPKNTEDQFDLMICTDVLAEGLNLQQCRNIINYDLPWNPMRLVQRHGRIDRLKSDHSEVYLYSFFPDERLDELLHLEYLIRSKLAYAAASIGVEDTPIVHGPERKPVYSDTIEEIKKIYDEDATIFEEGGSESAAQTGEIYRAELRRAIDERGIDPKELPRRIGSGFKKNLNKDQKAGYFFCTEVAFRDSNSEETKTRTLLRFVPKDSDDDDDIIQELATCLRLIQCTSDSENIFSPELLSGAYDAWEKAKQNIFNWWSDHTDPAKLQPTIPKINREVSIFLKEHPPTDLDQDQFNNILSSVEAPWRERDCRLLRNVWKMEFSTDQEMSQALCKKVEEIGVEPYVASKPLVAIEHKDIKLICWMAVEAEDE